ncbi:MAG: porin [Acetobacteraceae bacterium]|nr:porin [Acetobacteraceae bacterium]
MRKIMLAATAVAGLGLAVSANAQALNPTITSPGFLGSAGGAAPEAGTVAVYVKGKVYSAISAGSDSGSAGAGNAGKLNTTDIMTAMRLYFGFDGKSNQGLEYGSLIELRQFYDGQYQNGSAADPVQVRRERVYIGTPVAGRLTIGTTDGALGLLDTGDWGATPFDVVGGWVGDVNAYGRTKNTLLNYPFASQSGEYMTNKLVYTSPNFSGVDLALSFEPNMQSGLGYCAQNAYTATACNSAVSIGTSTIDKQGSRSNTIEAAARYKGSFGPAAVAAEVGTWQSNVVKGNANVTKGLSVLDAGLTASASGFTVGGHFMSGNMTGGNQPELKGAKQSQFGMVGASYTFGSTVVGASYIDLNSANSSVALGMLHETGVNVGATYDFAPGAAVFLSGIYGTRHENGFNILAGAAGATHNSVQARSIAVGSVFNF